ncbi:hypothetical protein [Aureispira sp. CCB-QB1]|uniref:hypothetical protein n=1 Tax=Aureispira sp. CCB-QB1 TaxID=1313421 RepID=UPI000695BBFB|nr:hypothetical protein [Aureispira sp. CCB-QB1]
MLAHQVKFLSIFCLLNSLVILNAQNSLEIEVLNCNENNSSGHIEYLNLYQNDSLIKVLDRHEMDSPIKNLQLGIYQLKYTSIFGKKHSIHFEIQSKSKKQIVVCADYIEHEKENYIPFIDQIKNDEEYSIKLFSSGCFYFSKDTIIISKFDNTFFISYKGYKKQLENKDVQKLRFFEIELNALSTGGGCTSSTSYSFTFKDKVFEKTDDSCKWRGLHFFMETIKQDY